jgi:hypothetical protein
MRGSALWSVNLVVPASEETPTDVARRLRNWHRRRHDLTVNVTQGGRAVPLEEMFLHFVEARAAITTIKLVE